ncbi:MAG: T9SS type A sorting domain-containing protein [Bacteroidota bacterium]|nr:T9SS type A sorting domain-containing protein [Bacteroidota bacterium]
MKKIIILYIFTLNQFNVKAQASPWQSPLKICTSTNGTTFNTATMFQDSSGVASVIRIGTSNSDTLMAAFQWFPAPNGNPLWDKVAVKYSYNGGMTWTAPTTCTFTGLPGGFQRPFDPSLIQLSNGQIRMYFSSGPLSSTVGLIDTYSSISNNGITYTFEPTTIYDSQTKNVIDPTVGYFSGTYYYNSWTGVNADGAFRATSTNGTSFTTQAVNPYDGSHLWLGNYMLDGSALKFYGCGANVWFNSTTNGTTWSGYTTTNVLGADPAVVKTKNGTYVMIYTGPPSTTDIDKNNNEKSTIIVAPTIFKDFITISSADFKNKIEIEIIDALGKRVYYNNELNPTEKNEINLGTIETGIYFCKITQGNKTNTQKIVKTN